MPKHAGIPGLEAFIVMEGQHCEEHDDRTPVASNCMERYIVAESGAGFEVQFRFYRPFPNDRPVSVVVTMDSKDLDEPLVRQHELHAKESYVSKGTISNIGEDFWREKYRFAELEIGKSSPCSGVLFTDGDQEKMFLRNSSTNRRSSSSTRAQFRSISTTFRRRV